MLVLVNKFACRYSADVLGSSLYSSTNSYILS